VRTLVALAVPPLGFTVLLAVTRAFFWEIAVIATCGSMATLAGWLDWRYHRSGAVRIGAPEHRAHFWALAAGGGSVCALMTIASVSARPLVWLLPVVVAVIGTVVLICYDEMVHHRRRRPGRYETALHRTLVLGNGAAFLAWAHWCFVRCGGA
jgi:hypothetical protein